MDIQMQNNNNCSYLDSASCGLDSNSGIFENFVTFKELEQNLIEDITREVLFGSTATDHTAIHTNGQL
jgi:hypothetical protein